MYKQNVVGKYGKDVAARYLKQKGYKIIKRDYYWREGEFDIIAEENEYIVFVEVNTRSNGFFENSIYLENKNKKKHMYNVAKYFLHIRGWEQRYIRFDIIDVYLEKGFAKVNHILQIL